MTVSRRPSHWDSTAPVDRAGQPGVHLLLKAVPEMVEEVKELKA